MVEAHSDISVNACEAVRALREARRELLESGATIMGAGVHPDAGTGQSGVSRAKRYALIAHSQQGVLHAHLRPAHTSILREGSGADLQRQVYTEGGMDALLEYLVRETARLHDPRRPAAAPA